LISAHVKHARGLATARKGLALSDAWDAYSRHPERAMPATVCEREAYRMTLAEFVAVACDASMAVSDVTPALADAFAGHMRTLDIAVATHNRKIKRLRRIFTVLKEYREGENPFAAKSLMRKAREEQAQEIRRLSFTREQEEALLEVLADTVHKVMHKPEVRVIYHVGMFTGQRFKDCIMLRWDKVDLNRRRIWVKQFKTGKEVTIPIAPKLLEVLVEAQSWKRDNYVCPNVAERYNKVDAKGKNTGNNLANIDVLRVIKWIGLEPSINTDFHGFS